MVKPNKIHSNHFFKQEIVQVYDQLLQNLLLQTTSETDTAYAQFPQQSSSVGQIISHLGTLEEITVSIRNRFPQNDPVSKLQKGIYLLTIIFCSFLDQFSLVDDPDI